MFILNEIRNMESCLKRYFDEVNQNDDFREDELINPEVDSLTSRSDIESQSQ